jgi:2-polyprenyl-3-methyl-5-hydroxy-6-metoxy-1,4-benzoquinol methylase
MARQPPWGSTRTRCGPGCESSGSIGRAFASPFSEIRNAREQCSRHARYGLLHGGEDGSSPHSNESCTQGNDRSLSSLMDASLQRSAASESLPAAVHGSDAVRRVVAAYTDPIIRSYSWGRFQIFRQRFLDEIGQYLPPEGHVLDIGCGFGLFALYYALGHPRLEISGFDTNARRIDIANATAQALGASNVRFHRQDARELEGDRARFDAIYMLDVVHHVPRTEVESLLREVKKLLRPRGVLLIKELDTKPVWQRVFSHVLDLAMSPSSPPDYWSAQDLSSMLTRLGFVVKRHAMVDILPYPHVLYVAHLA